MVRQNRHFFLACVLLCVQLLVVTWTWEQQYRKDRLLLDPKKMSNHLRRRGIDLLVTNQSQVVTFLLENVKNLSQPLLSLELDTLCEIEPDNVTAKENKFTYGLLYSDFGEFDDVTVDYTVWSIVTDNVCEDSRTGRYLRYDWTPEQLLNGSITGCPLERIHVPLDSNVTSLWQQSACVEILVLMTFNITGAGSYNFTWPDMRARNFSQYQVSAFIGEEGPCPDHLYACPKRQKCFDFSQKCDFINDCENGFDESLCSNNCDFNNGTCFWTLEGGFVLANEWKLIAIDRDTRPGNFVMFRIEDNPNVPVASITSSWFGRPNSRDCEVHFDYLRYRENIGDLKVMFLLIGGEYQTRLRIKNNTVVKWRKAKSFIGDIKTPFRIRFEFEPNLPIDGGVCALDNIRMLNCDIDTYAKDECPGYKCHNGECIDRKRICDLESDCASGDDELNCRSQLPSEAYVNFEDGPNGWNVTVGTIVLTNRTLTGPGRANEPVGNYIILEPEVKSISGSHKGAPLRNNFLQATASMLSPVFPAPPKNVHDKDSPYYESCQVRMRVYILTIPTAELRLEFVSYDERTGVWNEVHSSESSSTPFVCRIQKFSRGMMPYWQMMNCPLPRLIKCPYRVAIKATAFLSPVKEHKVRFAIDDITMSLECFGKGSLDGVVLHSGCTERLLCEKSRFRNATTKAYDPPVSHKWAFSNCGARGRTGPTQTQCDSYYSAPPALKVRVYGAGEKYEGAQVWTIPETREYTITAMGAAGGSGAKNPGFGLTAFQPSSGSLATGVFNLTKGDKIYILIGQKGEDACEKVTQTSVHEDLPRNICMVGSTDKADEKLAFRNFAGGGGGGGGATFVWKVDENNETVPLIVAGGGGGLAYRMKALELTNQEPKSENETVYLHNDNDIKRKCRLIRTLHIPGVNAKTVLDGAGGGGGWNGSHTFSKAGGSLFEGANGGVACQRAIELYKWNTAGGFGGGGGACTAGGGGGGYIGGEASLDDGWDVDGGFGASFLHPDAYNPEVECGTNIMDGEVVVAPYCACEDLCLGIEDGITKCGCMKEGFIPKGLICVPDITPPPILLPDEINEKKPPSDYHRSYDLEQLSTSAMIGIIIGCLLLVCSFTLCLLFVLRKQKIKRQISMRLEILNQESQLERLRQGNLMTELNPHYDFCGAKCSLADLVQIPRENLSLISALGQGAFGEVYKGYLSNLVEKACEMAVAVKTLQAMSTERAEQDFMMEALIMSKFDHPNIVKFYGVCFDNHPRFIVLELLDGGDLKTFLRDSRPRNPETVTITMTDLVRMSIDVAKGCQYLEQNHFIHRDIAARNCLLTCREPSDGCLRMVKIADFGMARDVYRADYYRKGGQAMVPVKWMPPEAFLDGIFTSKTDSWSFGILLWEVFSLGYMPYPGRGNQEVMQYVATGGRLEPPACCPIPLYRIMTQCWHAQYEKRPSFTDILERLDECLEDTDVIAAQLPIFSRRPSMDLAEPDRADRRHPPADVPTTPSDQSETKMFPESDMEDSTEQLLHRRPEGNLNSSANLCVSAESIDRLLIKDDRDGITAATDARSDSDHDSLIGSSSPDLSMPSAVSKAPSNRSLSYKSHDRTSSSGQSMTMTALSNSTSTVGDLEPLCNGLEHSHSLEHVSNGGGDLNGYSRSRPSIKHPVTAHTMSLPLDQSNKRNYVQSDLYHKNHYANNAFRAPPNGARVNNYYVTGSNDGPITVSEQAERRPNGYIPQYQTSMV